MTLIPCPECEQSVSDLASACPHCGFPVAAGIRAAVAEITQEDSARSARQQHAAERLKSWGERYLAPPEGKRPAPEGESFIDRHWRPLVFVFAASILALQLFWVFSLF